MDGPLVIRVFIQIVNLFIPVLTPLAQIILIPQLLLKHLREAFYVNFDCRNIIQLTSQLLFYGIYLSVYLNLHIIIFFKYYLGIHTFMQLLFSFLILNSLTAILYKFLDMRFFIAQDVSHFLYLVIYEIIWVIILICLIITFGNLQFYDFLLFRNIFGFFELTRFFFFALFETFKSLLLHIMIALHFINPISAIRAISMIRKENDNELFKKTYQSVIMIVVDFFLLFALIINVIFIKGFVISLFDLVKDVYCNKYDNFEFMPQHVNFIKNSENSQNVFTFKFSQFDLSVNYAKFYLYIKHVFILKKFYSNIKILCALFAFVPSLVIFWKIPKNLKILYNFILEDDERKNLKLFMLISALNLVEGFIELITPVVFIYNHLNPINYFSLKNVRHYYSTRGGNAHPCPASILNLIVFINKGFDYLVTIFSMTRIFNFTFIMYLLRAKRLGCLSEIRFFPLMKESESFLKTGKEENEKHKDIYHSTIPVNENLLHYQEYMLCRRYQLLMKTIRTNLENFFLISTLPSLLDPFHGLRYFRYVYQYILYAMKSPSGMSFGKISNYLLRKIVTIFFGSIFTVLFYLPVNLILSLTAPWCIFEFLIFAWNFSVLKQIKKISQINPKKELKLKEDENLEKNENLDKTENSQKSEKSAKKSETLKKLPKIAEFSKNMLHKWYTGWVLIIKFLSIHLSILRAIILWKEFFFLKKYKQEKIKRSSSNNLMINKKNSADTMSVSMSSNLPGFKRQLSSSTENFLSSNDPYLFRFLLNKNFSILFLEIYFYPFIILFALITPWSILKMKKFFSVKEFGQKIEIFFKELLYDFIHDLYTMLSVVVVLLSVVNTLPMIVLIYHSFKRNFIGDENSILQYDLLYKNDFRDEAKALSSGIFKKILILILIILNILLITRIFSLYRRVKRFLMAKLAKDFSKIRHMFDTKIQTDHHVFHSLGNTVFTSIFQFLPPGDLHNLALANKILYNKTKINLVWRNEFDNYYRKKLKENSTPEVCNLFNTDNYSDYRVACQEASKYLGEKKPLTEEQRDSLIGLYAVVIEETVESLLKIPHLLLIPAKIISLPIYYMTKFLIQQQIKFGDSQVFEDYLKDSYFSIKHEKIFNSEIEDLSFSEKFYNMQTFGVTSILQMLFLIIFNILSIIVSSFLIFIKIICLDRIKLPLAQVNEKTLTEKVSEIKFVKLIVQIIFTTLIVLTHLVIILYPLYYWHKSFFDNLTNFYFYTQTESTASLMLNSLLNPINYLYFICDIGNAWWERAFFYKIGLLIKTGVLNIIALCLNGLITEGLCRYYRKTNVIVYDVVKFIFIPRNGLMEIMAYNIGVACLYPQVLVFKYIYRYCKLYTRDNVVISLFINCLLIFIMFYPFYLNFKIEWSFYRFITLNFYAVTNLIKVVDITKRY
jgi:hypothetical protein